MEPVELILAAIGILGGCGIFSVYVYVGRRASKQDDKLFKQEEKLEKKQDKTNCLFNMDTIKRETKTNYEVLAGDVNEIKILIKENRDESIAAREKDREFFNKFQLEVVNNLAAINTRLKGMGGSK